MSTTLIYNHIKLSKPSLILTYQNSELLINHAELKYTLNLNPKQALDFLSNFTKNLSLPKIFQKIKTKHQYQYGLAGYFSFEFGLKLLNLKLDKKKLKQQTVPDFYFFLPTEIEYLSNTGKVLEKINILNEKIVFETPSKKFSQKTKHSNIETKSNLSLKQYLNKIKKVFEKLEKGETYQVNFAQKWTTQNSLQPEELFTKLTKLNPSEEQAMLKTANFAIVSNSPETLFIKTSNKLSTYPIKGTLKKPNNPQILLDSKKDQAELEMIVDLARNDLGRIAKPGTVKVNKHRYIKEYNNLYHTVSEISCEIEEKTTLTDIINTLFPAGSITGCPKIRTSQIIHDIEPDLRETYTGSLGFFNHNGDAHFNILIRTLLALPTEINFHAGGGITVQSDPQEEYFETLQKAENIFKIIT